MKIHRFFTSELVEKMRKNFSEPLHGKPEHYSDVYMRMDYRYRHLSNRGWSVIFILEGSDWVLPVSLEYMHEDGSPFLCLGMELSIPNQDYMFTDACKLELAEAGIRLDPTSRGEFFIPTRPVDVQRKELKRVYRYYKKSVQAYNFRVHTDPSKDFMLQCETDVFPHYYKYWMNKGCYKDWWSTEDEYVSYAADQKSGAVQMVTVHDGDLCIGLGYFLAYPDELYWIQSKRNIDPKYNKAQVGNSILFHALETMDQSIPKLNLGVSYLNYKAEIWKPEECAKPNLLIADSEKLYSIIHQLSPQLIGDCIPR